MADLRDLATTTTMPDDAEVVIQPAGDVEPLRLDGASMRTAFKGDQGDQGVMGAQGNVGSQGSQGNVGSQGSQGNVGAQGQQGTAGNDGNDGTDGAQGLYTVEIYRNVLTAQASITPTGGSIVVATAAVVAPNLWATTLTPAPTGQKTIISRTVINPETQSGTITPTWSASFDAGGTGPSGPQGPMGAAGAMGTAGAAGQDSTVPGPTGPAGAAGAPGPTGLPDGSLARRDLKWDTSTSAWLAVSDVTTVYYGAAADDDYLHVSGALAAGLNTAGVQIATDSYLLYKDRSTLRNDHMAALWAGISQAPSVFVLAPAHTEWIHDFTCTVRSGPLTLVVASDFVYINGLAYDIAMAVHPGVEADVGSVGFRYTTPAELYAITQTPPP